MTTPLFSTSSTASGLPPRVLRPTGRFDAHEAPGFRADFAAVVAEGHHDVIVDLHEVVFIDSTALSELVSAQRTLAALGGTLTLHGLTVPVRVILEVTGLNSVFVISP